MARPPLGPIIAPILVGACVAATTQPAREPTQVVREVTELREPRPVEREPAGAEVLRAELLNVPLYAPAVPVHEIEDRFVPLTPAQPFTRTTDRTRIEARGATRIDGIDSAALRAAAAVDNQTWALDQRRELLAFLRGSILDRNPRFTEADARIIAQLQAGSGAGADGMLGDETMAVLLAVGFHFSNRKLPGPAKLEFYPGELEDIDAWNREIAEKVTTKGGGFQDVDGPLGEGTIYVRVGGAIVAGYRARGGPPTPLEDGKHVALPTAPGTYRLGPGHRHITSNWHYSQIPWGAEIREIEGGYQYRSDPRGKWSWATLHPSGTLKEPFANHEFGDLPEVTRAGVTYFIWNKNDFGPIAWNLVPSDQYVHTTPNIEALTEEATPGTTTVLGFSHGCIHIDPRERDEMMKRGFLGEGIPFVVHAWDEHRLPDEIRREMISPTAP